MEHFRTFFHLPEGRVNLRKECVCIFDDGVDMCDDEAVCISHGLSVNLATTDDEATGIPELVVYYTGWFLFDRNKNAY